MWQIINVEPSDGECSICRSHECGVVDGKHQWIMSDYLGQETDRVYIGYKCVKLFAENLGISKQVVEKIVHVPSTNAHLLSEAFAKLQEYEESIKHGNDPVVSLDNDHSVTVEPHIAKPKATSSHRGKATTKK